MLDGEMREALESGCSIVVGLLSAAGTPFATRAWGVDVLDGELGTARVLVGSGDLRRTGRAWEELPGSAIAVTSADVRTFRSIQLKGTVLRVEPATPAFEERAQRLEHGIALEGLRTFGAADGEVVAGAGLPTDADSDQVGRDRVERVGLGVEGEACLLLQLVEECLERVGRVDERVLDVLRRLDADTGFT